MPVQEEGKSDLQAAFPYFVAMCISSTQLQAEVSVSNTAVF